MKTNNIMIRIEKFLTGEKEQQLFYSLGKEVKVRKGWVTIENLNQGKEENVSILTDDEKRIRCKAKDISFSLKQDGKNFMIDHLQLKDKTHQKFLSLRRKKKGEKDIYRIRMEEKDRRTIYWLKEDSIEIVENNGEEKASYTFKKAKDGSLNAMTRDQREACWNCFKRLERDYATITAYISSHIAPIFKEAIDYCNPYKQAKETKIYCKTPTTKKL